MRALISLAPPCAESCSRLDHAEFCARAYLSEADKDEAAPAYRISLEYLRPGPAVLAERRHLVGKEPQTLQRFYIAADEANRSLDLCEYFHANPEPRSPTPHFPRGRTRLAEETDRARVKFRHVLERLPAARAAVTAALERIVWFETTP